MRIISGTLKGRRLNSWKNIPELRPMTDRIKESVFNTLKPYLFEGSLFLDLFSGTGSLALEALSRGAKEAHIVEKNPLCLNLIKKNSQILSHKNKLVLHKSNVFSFLSRFKKTKNQQPPVKAFDIIIADPPFKAFAGEKTLKGLQNSFLTKANSRIVIETGQKEELKSKYPPFYLFSKKVFNDKKVWFYEK